MSQRTALLATTALTVFLLIVMVGIAWQVSQKLTVDALAVQQAAAPTQAAVNLGAPPAAAEPAQPANAEREAAYQQLIQQANQRLEQANKEQQALAKQLELAKQNQVAHAPAAASQPAKHNISPDQAVAIALNAEKGAILSKPAELIDFQGTVAYEVTLDRGVVYVDANNGNVLYDSAVTITIHDAGSNQSNGGGKSAAPAPAPAPAPKPQRESEDHSKEQGGEHGGD